jgi:hypothetical protein
MLPRMPRSLTSVGTLFAIMVLAGCGGTSAKTSLEHRFSNDRYSVKCQKEGIVAVAGTSSDFYSCQQVFAEGPPGAKLCAVWVHGSPYLVTDRIRRMEGSSSPC